MVVQSPQWPLPVHSLGHLFQLIPVRHELFRRSRRHGLLDVPLQRPLAPGKQHRPGLSLQLWVLWPGWRAVRKKFRQRHLVPHQTREEQEVIVTTLSL